MPMLKKHIHKFFLNLFTSFFVIFILCTSSYGYRRESAVVRAVREVSPAVVNICSEYEVHRRANPFSGFGDPFFDSFFRDFFDPGYERRYKKSSLGSGVIIDGKRGLVLTNAHVIARTGTITVIMRDEREFEAQIVGADPDSDLAILRISSSKSLPAVEMGSSDDIMIGETVIAIGNPFGFSHTVTTGVVSAINRSVRTEDIIYHNFIQTDASINPGNSGGPLLNINGDLIGINTAIYAKAQGIGFAIPINKAKRIVSDLVQYGEVVPAWIGLVVQNPDARLAQYLKIPDGKRGVLVRAVEQGSPAIRAGIQEGDIILSLGNMDIGSTQDYHAALKNFAGGDTVKMDIWRNRKKERISVKAGIFPIERAESLAYNLLGVKVENLSQRGRYHYGAGVTEGVVISDIRPGSYLANIGAGPGDVIRQMDDMTIKNVKDFQKAIVKYRKKGSVVILLQRGNQGYYITVKF
ncbi:Do family serine endopeptidase [Desulfobacterales bacterium HSG2]|nr:Do family serine endopeptidase [Desulfobacterales bacterium HSG2]